MPQEQSPRPDDRGNFRTGPGNTAPRTLLIVDDEPLIRWVLAQALSDLPRVRVVEAPTAEAAFEALGEGALPIDLMLLDLVLPDKDGVTVLRRLRDAAPDCPVVVITAYDRSELADAARTLGVSGLVPKPFDVQAVRTLVGHLLAPATPN